jgi:hypothetical protein
MHNVQFPMYADRGASVIVNDSRIGGGVSTLEAIIPVQISFSMTFAS